MSGDSRLERLYDYTKFHIGIYLSAAGGLAALLAAAAKDGPNTFVSALVGSPIAFWLAFFLIAIAGGAGAMVATLAIKSENYDSFSVTRHSPFSVPNGKGGRRKIFDFKGSRWESIEHRTFWLSLIFIAYGVFSAPGVPSWIFHNASRQAECCKPIGE